MKKIVAIAVALVVLFAAVTYTALEFGGVAVIETQTEDGTTRTTHVWFARKRKDLWLEAGAASNGWFVDIQQTGEHHLIRGANVYHYHTVVVDKPGVRRQVRALLRERYGWRDRWVGLFVDHESAIPVKLVRARTNRDPTQRPPTPQ